MNAEQYGSHLRRTTAWECRTPFRPRANIDIDWIKTNIWEGNLASDLKRKFDQEQALSFTYVMQNKYVHVCHCNWYLNGQGWCDVFVCADVVVVFWDWRSMGLTFLLCLPVRSGCTNSFVNYQNINLLSTCPTSSKFAVFCPKIKKKVVAFYTLHLTN